MSHFEDYLASFIQEAIDQSLQQQMDSLLEKVERATQEPYLTREKLKEITGWSDRTLQHLRDTEQITYVQHGRKILYPRDEFYEFLEANKFKPRS